MNTKHIDLSMSINRRGGGAPGGVRAGAAWVAAGMVAIAASIGCDSSSPLYPVRGQVLIDGVPLTTGNIRFVPEHGRPASSAIRESGLFRMTSHSVGGHTQEGLLPGVYRVSVSSNEITSDESTQWLAPAHYADFRTSGLEVNVDRPLDSLKIELTWADEADNIEAPAADAASDEVANGGGAEAAPAAIMDH